MSNVRFNCTCDPIRARDEREDYVYPRQVLLELPLWSKDRQRRLKEGMSTAISVDACIREKILDLWDKGIETTGCCCGHNYMPAWVSVDRDCYADMFALAYFQKMPEVINNTVMGLYTFYL